MPPVTAERSPTILVVEDDDGLNRLIGRMLGRAGFTVVSTHCGADALAAMADIDDPLLLLDYRLPDMSADELVERLNGARQPFVIMTGNGDEHTAVRMMKRGARDYLVKDDHFLERVPHTVQRVVREIAAERSLALADREIRARDEEQRRIIALLRLVNSAQTRTEFVRTLLDKVHSWSGCDAVGIRIADGDDFPYYETRGFESGFVAAERFLCVRDGRGELEREDGGCAVLECMCGAVIRGTADPALSYFTDQGSFWTPSTSDLEATTDEEQRGWTRNRCVNAGYESVALLPLRYRDRTFGLLQLNAYRRDALPPRALQFYERVADHVAIALSQFLAQEDLQRSEERYRSYIDNAPDGVAVTDDEGRLVEVNPALCGIGGFSEQELIGRPMESYLPKESNLAAREGLALLRRTGRAAFEVRGLRKDGAPLWLSLACVRLSENRLLGFVKDITQRRQAEAERERLESQLRHQQKLESLGTLAGGVAHEINNPIHIVMNCVELAQEQVSPDSELAINLQDIADASERVATIVRNLLAFARADTEVQGPARIGDLVDRTVSLIRKVFEKDQVSMTVDVPCDLPLVRCRPDQIQQVLMNLLTNARDALNARFPDGDPDKRIRITAQSLEDDRGHWLRTTIEDRGAGVPADLRERIFDPFFTTKPRDQGTGLGLSVSHGIVADHGGQLTVDSAVGKPTRFHVDLRADDGWLRDTARIFADETTLY